MTGQRADTKRMNEMNGTFYVPGSGEYAELARTPSGKLFRKRILKFGAWQHPGNPDKTLTIDRPFAESLVKNFNDHVCDIVQVPLADGQNRHHEDPLRNIGEVVDLEVEDDGVYATIDARKPDAADQLGKTLLGASAMIHTNYTDTGRGEKVGPTLLHVLVTNRPYITDLGNYEEIVAASADNSGDEPLVLSEQEEGMEIDLSTVSREDLVAALRENFDVDVDGLEQAVDNIPAQLSAALEEAGLNLSNNEGGEPVTTTEVAEAVLELAAEVKMRDERIEALEAEHEKDVKENVTREVDDLVKAGRVLPVQKDSMVELALSNRDMFDKIVPADAIVTLSEDGVTVSEEPDSQEKEAEITRLANQATEIRTGGRK